MDIEKLNIGRKQLAKIYNYSENHINLLVKKYGAPKNTGHNSYPLVDFIRWHTNYLDEQHKEGLQKIKSDKPQDVLAIKSAELKDLLIREKRGELVLATDVEDSWLNEIAVINAGLDGMAIKAAPHLLGIKSVKKMKDKLIIEINKVKTKIAKLKLHTAGPKSTK